MLHIDVAEFGKRFLHAFMARIVKAEIKPEFLVRVLRVVEFPDALIVTQKRVHGRDALDPWFQRRAGERERAALRDTEAADAARIDLREVHHDAGELCRIEEYLAKGQFACVGIVETTDDVSPH